MPKEESFLWNLYEEKDENKILESSCSEETYSLENHKEYHFKNFNEHSKYTRKNFHDDLLGVIEKYMPKIFLQPLSLIPTEIIADYIVFCS